MVVDTELINELKTIFKNGGILRAVRHMRDHTGMPLKDCKEFIENLHHLPHTDGTITWYEIAKGDLPNVPSTGNVSKNILIYKKNKTISEGYYHETTNTFIFANSAIWQPTHWAYINYPD